MADSKSNRRTPVIVAIIIAMMLEIAPLPETVDPYRPDWVLLTLIYWSLVLPRSYGVGIAWVVGIIVDVAQGTLLGQHALAMASAVALTVRFHLQLRVFPLSQLTLMVGVLIGIYQFILFWVNGVAGISAPAHSFWGPVVTGTLFWPLVYWISGMVNTRRSTT